MLNKNLLNYPLFWTFLSHFDMYASLIWHWTVKLKNIAYTCAHILLAINTLEAEPPLFDRLITDWIVLTFICMKTNCYCIIHAFIRKYSLLKHLCSLIRDDPWFNWLKSEVLKHFLCFVIDLYIQPICQHFSVCYLMQKQVNHLIFFYIKYIFFQYICIEL